MATKHSADIKKIAKLMADLDLCMLTTRTADGALHARPMSNNGEVEFDGDVWFFSSKDSRKVAEIEEDAEVQLSYADLEDFRFISMSGEALIVDDVDKKQELWLEELRQWFPDGPESEDVVLIKVTPKVVAYWSGDGDGEIELA
ncbi:MAG: pyridoxamine 5'-phosphate oxidase family protein [Gemmatimonadota bacterium]